MSIHSSSTRALGAALVVLTAVSCGGPTSPSPKDPSPGSTAGAGGEETFGLAGSASNETAEEFNCRDVEEVHFRFSAPGYVRGSHVGLYTRYSGVPAGEKLLRIWWDYENDTTDFRDVNLGEGEIRRDNAGLFDIEYLAEHAYPPVNGPVERLVRAELILLGKTGNCARNRVVTLDVEPPEDELEAASDQDACEGLRFCKLGDGTVRDMLTGIVWLENANCVGLRRLPVATSAVAGLASGQCGLSDGSAPGDWRIPTLSEIQSLIDPRFQDPSLSNARGDGQWIEGDAFSRVQSRFTYWSSDWVETCILGRPGLSVLSLADGDVRCQLPNIGFARTWPVRAP